MAEFSQLPLFEAPARGNPSEFRDEIFSAKTKGIGLPYGENFIILTSTVFVWSIIHPCDRRTGDSIYNAVARKNY